MQEYDNFDYTFVIVSKSDYYKFLGKKVNCYQFAFFFLHL